MMLNSDVIDLLRKYSLSLAVKPDGIWSIYYTNYDNPEFPSGEKVRCRFAAPKENDNFLEEYVKPSVAALTRARREDVSTRMRTQKDMGSVPRIVSRQLEPVT
jgi:hypothetical protein